MGVREIDRSLEQWQMGVKDLRRRVILAPTPRERERWYAILLLAQGLTAAATAEALERDPHTIGRWASAFGEGGPAALIFEQTGGSPPALDQAQQEELKGAVEQPPATAGIVMANWYWKVVRQFVSERFDRRQLVLPVATTIFAGRDGVIIRYGGAVDYRPTNQAIEAETYGRQDTGNGSGQGWDERAFSAQVAEWPIAVAGETGASVAHSARSLRRGVGG